MVNIVTGLEIEIRHQISSYVHWVKSMLFKYAVVLHIEKWQNDIFCGKWQFLTWILLETSEYMRFKMMKKVLSYLMDANMKAQVLQIPIGPF